MKKLCVVESLIGLVWFGFEARVLPGLGWPGLTLWTRLTLYSDPLASPQVLGLKVCATHHTLLCS